jgi:HK97 gp10 family phage protein
MAKRQPRYLMLTGDKELDRILKGLPFAIQGRILRTAMRQAARPVQEEVRRTFPKKTGRTARRFRTKTTRPKPDGTREARVGVFGKATGGANKDFATARAAEFGTAHLPAKFPLRRALAARQTEVRSTLQDVLAREIREQALIFWKTGK